MKLAYSTASTPLGRVCYVLHAGALCALGFEEQWSELMRGLERRFGSVELFEQADPGGVTSRLEAYFRGETEALAGLPIDLGGTAFQGRVWEQLQAIPAGRTASYREIARAIGEPRAVRAVGAANGANPVCLVVPCHRVVRSDGTLCGYAGGAERKKWLLEHEAKHAPWLKRAV